MLYQFKIMLIMSLRSIVNVVMIALAFSSELYYVITELLAWL